MLGALIETRKATKRAKAATEKLAKSASSMQRSVNRPNSKNAPIEEAVLSYAMPILEADGQPLNTNQVRATYKEMKPGRSEQAERMFLNRSMLRNKLKKVKTLLSGRGAVDFWERIEQNWAIFDKCVNKMLEWAQRNAHLRPRGQQLIPLVLNCGETFCREHYRGKSSYQLVKQTHKYGVNCKSKADSSTLGDSYGGSTLLAFLSSCNDFIIPPVVIFSTKRPTIFKQNLCIRVAQQYTGLHVRGVRGNRNGKHWMCADTWQSIISHVAEWKTKLEQSLGVRFMVLWVYDDSSTHKFEQHQQDVLATEHLIWTMKLKGGTTSVGNVTDSFLFRSLKAKFRKNSVPAVDTLLNPANWKAYNYQLMLKLNGPMPFYCLGLGFESYNAREYARQNSLTYRQVMRLNKDDERVFGPCNKGEEHLDVYSKVRNAMIEAKSLDNNIIPVAMDAAIPLTARQRVNFFG